MVFWTMGCFTGKLKDRWVLYENSFGIGECKRLLCRIIAWQRERNSLTKSRRQFHMEMRDILQRIASLFTEFSMISVRIGSARFECAFGRMCPTIWPSLEMCWDIQIACWFQASVVSPPRTGKTSKYSWKNNMHCLWACPIIVCLISVIPFKNQPVTVLGR